MIVVIIRHADYSDRLKHKGDIMLILVNGVMQVLYDVCNDYSLEESDGINFIPTKYKKVNGQGGTLFIDKEYGELHYYSGKPGMDGQHIYGGTEA
jgi:hypothetical protein